MAKSLQSDDMIEKSITITNNLGLHARASSKFVTTATKYLSEIEVTSQNKTVNGKSIMGVMMLAAKKGTSLKLKIKGEDEQQMLAEIESLIENKFGEDE